MVTLPSMEFSTGTTACETVSPLDQLEELLELVAGDRLHLIRK